MDPKRDFWGWSIVVLAALAVLGMIVVSMRYEANRAKREDHPLPSVGGGS